MKYTHAWYLVLALMLVLITISPCVAENSNSDSALKWKVIDDPYPSEPSDWVFKDGVITQNSNIYRTQDEYRFWQGTHIVSGDPDGTDYVLTFKMKTEDNDGIGAIIRYQDKDNYYRFISVTDSGNKGPFSRLEKFENGKRTVIDESSWSYEQDKEYSVVFSAVGDTLDVVIDGKKILHGIDDTFSSGKIGFLTYAQTGFTVWNLAVKPPLKK